MNIVPIDYAIHLNDILEIFSESLKNTNGRAWFEWKHLRNPFGKSIGYIAEENGEMLGVRLFMQWQFRCNGQVFKALRPVDTVTRPRARGKGIFTSLTRRALEECKGKYDFIFNTPNQKSLPGYLKMGWRVLDQSFGHFYMLPSPWGRIPDLRIVKKFPGIDKISGVNISDVCSTFVTEDFLQWRYEDDRYAFAKFDSNLLIFEIVRKKGVSILIVKEFTGEAEFFRPVVYTAARNLGASLILCTNNFCFNFKKPFLAFERGKSIVAYRGDDRYYNLKWNFSLGDLEGIL